MPGAGERASSPGPRLNYGLHETAVRCDVTQKVRQAKADVLCSSQPDILGLKGPQWQPSVYVSPAKFPTAASDLALTNTLHPGLINPHDFRTLARTTHVPGSPHTAALLPRSTAGSGGWNTSTYYEAGERERGVRETTQRSLSASRARNQQLLGNGTYTSPVQRAVQVGQRVREAKAEAGEDLAALEARYGKEGAQALLLSLSKASPQPTRSTTRARASPADLKAVLQLPDLPAAGEEWDSRPDTASGPGEQQARGGAGA
ncbi:hypothetical protein V8C86DRAFT_1263104 [Haematococcus lacustris]